MTAPSRSTEYEKTVRNSLEAALIPVLGNMIAAAREQGASPEFHSDLGRLLPQILLMSTYKLRAIEKQARQEGDERAEEGFANSQANFEAALASLTQRIKEETPLHSWSSVQENLNILVNMKSFICRDSTNTREHFDRFVGEPQEIAERFRTEQTLHADRIERGSGRRFER